MVTKARFELVRTLPSRPNGAPWQLHQARRVMAASVASPLAARRTRGGSGIPNVTGRRTESDTEDDADESVATTDPATFSPDIATRELARLPPKPENTRVLLEVAQLN
jgi:hypothetical protein